MELNQAIPAAGQKKVALLEGSPTRYMYRSFLAGVYLTFGSLIAFLLADYFGEIAPALGKFMYALFFGWGLVAIIFLNAELATSNMMYLSYSAYQQKISWANAFKVLFVCTLFNLVGSVLIALMASETALFANLSDSHYLFGAVQGKFDKPYSVILIDGLLANVLVNMAIIGNLRLKSDAGKIIYVIGIIFIFAFFGFEHVIANFGGFSLAYLLDTGVMADFTLPAILLHWVVSFVANFLGGGVVMGIGYAWLNQTQTSYLD